MNNYEFSMLENIKEISRSGVSFDEKLQKAKELKQKEPSSRWVRLFYSTLLADNSQYMKFGWEIDLRKAITTL
ncbi:hypothetical protein OAT67_02530 [Bacteriovoracaceae bacterium]|nr:hypothetical protein [Bacteriovoracaceae bacterium]